MTILLHEPPFESISGEAGFFTQGSFATFIRLQGCNLNCVYCDTPKAQNAEGGTRWNINEVVFRCQTKQVLITGGEPLMQESALIALVTALISRGHLVQIETNGSLSIPKIGSPWAPPQYKPFWVVDRKGPSSRNKPVTEIPFSVFDRNVIVKYIISRVCSPYHEKDKQFIVEDMDRLDHAGYGGNYIISPMSANPNVGPLFFYKQRHRVIISLQIHKILGLA